MHIVPSYSQAVPQSVCKQVLALTAYKKIVSLQISLVISCYNTEVWKIDSSCHCTLVSLDTLITMFLVIGL